VKRGPKSTHPPRGVRYTLSDGPRNLSEIVGFLEDVLDVVEAAEEVVKRVAKATSAPVARVPLPNVKRADVLCASCGGEWTPGHTCKKVSE
jgi:hypothetical protein